jgi:glycosyltransferase involved in cell wall biosynthesis
VQQLPANWQTVAFDQISVDRFLSEIDLFLHFVHDDYIEEFGRNVMEAMAAGVPTLLPQAFRETFGDAAVYCEPKEVAVTARQLWSDPAAYRAQVERGYDHVLRTSDQSMVVERLSNLVRRRTSAAA